MKTFISTFVIAFVFSSPILAQDKTPFETLRDAFNNADTGAKIDDFETDLWTNCVYVNTKNPNTTASTIVRVLQWDDVTDNGPLFPGGGNRRVDVFNDYSVDQKLASFFAASTIRETDEYLKQSLSGYGWNQVNILGKKQNGLLLFSAEYSENQYTQIEPKIYGYCWDKDQQQEKDLPLPVPQ